MTEPVTKHDDVEMGSERGFGLVFAAVFAIIALWPTIFYGAAPRWWATLIAIMFVVVALFRSAWLRPLNFVWFRFGLLLGRIVTPVVMAALYVTTIVPIGLFLRLRGKDLLRLKREPERKSYWIEREPGPAAGTMKRQF
jgi:low temperature requirement protein LtrA